MKYWYSIKTATGQTFLDGPSSLSAVQVLDCKPVQSWCCTGVHTLQSVDMYNSMSA